MDRIVDALRLHRRGRSPHRRWLHRASRRTLRAAERHAPTSNVPDVRACGIDDGVKREVLARTDIGEVIGAYVTLAQARQRSRSGCARFTARSRRRSTCIPTAASSSASAAAPAATCSRSCRSTRTSASPMRCASSPSASASRSRTKTRARRARAASARRSTTPTTSRARGSTACCSRRARASGARVLRRTRHHATRRSRRSRSATRRTGWDGLVGELRRNDVDLPLAATAGLLKPSQRGGFYDFYRDRLMIPTLRDHRRDDRLRRTRARRRASRSTSTPRRRRCTPKGRYLFALNVARRAAARDDTRDRRRRLSRLHRAAPSGVRERGRGAGHRVHARTGARAAQGRDARDPVLRCGRGGRRGDAQVDRRCSRRGRRRVGAAHPRRQGSRRVRAPQRRRRVPRAARASRSPRRR